MDSKSEDKYDLIVACVGNDELDESIINAAYKKSRLSSCKWQVLNIFLKKPEAYSESRIQRLIKKATILKADIVKFPGNTISEGILEYAKIFAAKDKKILFLIGTRKLKHFSDFFRRTTYSQVRAPLKALGIEVKMILHERGYGRNYTFISPIFNFDAIAGMVETIICVSIAFITSYLLNYVLPMTTESMPNNIYLIYLCACIVPSIRGGFIPGLMAATLSLVIIDFFFLQPIKHFNISNTNDLYNLLVFFVATMAVSLIGGGTRKYIIEASQKEAYLNALLNVSETLNRPLSEGEALSYIYYELEKLFGTEIALFTPGFMDSSRLHLAYPDKIEDFSENEKNAFNICCADYRSTGFLTSTFPQSKWYFEPMMSPTGFQGILAVKLADSRLRYESNVISILLGFADLSATIIDRIEHTQVLEENRITEEKEKLRTMLLSSVSHDLKTPLASIIGSLDVYHNLGDKLSKKDKLALTQTSLHEAQRLDSFITNILDMAKLESGSIKFNKEWKQTRTVLDKALDMASSKLGKREKNITGDNYEIEVDQNMILRALANLFDNISKYTPGNSTISIKYGSDDNGNFSIMIRDNGPGIEEGMLEAIFNKYTRIKKLDNKIAGTGLGLPISKSIIEAHGGTIFAFNNQDGTGASFKITLPNYRLSA